MASIVSGPAMRRFYTTAQAWPMADGFTVLLDGRGLKTPAKAAFVAPTLALAQACAAEWTAQEEAILPETMPLTRLAHVALDRTPAARAGLAAGIAGYVETDLVCHHAHGPQGLRARQSEIWGRWAAWGRERLGARLAVMEGVIAAPPDPDGVQAATRAAMALDDWALTGLAHAVGLMGSAALGFALADRAIDGRAALEAAALDDLHQLTVWGEDAGARARIDHLAADLIALEAWFAALSR
jgi:chaperone required for assembly of F1-ATPase